ncbi:hypothetical protein CRE_12119 [Caenorhabditis remanei]|uniref:RRM domain-containing protein n=1 Tax=Caenorhabditis remanei TaxID=31234 RepID=E3MPZ6_CAERE|nr:hypothetical protein CRE_12119 [Caenorhabditis remanei]
MASIIDNNCNNFNSMDLELEAEAKVLKEIQTKMFEKMDTGKMTPPTEEEQKAIDAKSIFVSNVEFGATIEELKQHFKGCGEIVRTTIPKDKHTKKQKNYAFIEFDSASSVENAAVMNGSTFRGMGYSTSRGRGGRGGPQTVIVKYVYVNGPAPKGCGGFRGGRGRFNPY